MRCSSPRPSTRPSTGPRTSTTRFPTACPIERVDVGSDGALLLSPGDPLTAEYVFTQPGIELEGERVATGTNAELVLWRTDGPVVVAGATSNDELRERDCA